MAHRQRVLVLCTGNSARSQLAEGWLRAYAGDRFEVHSAGSRPSGRVLPGAVDVMREIEVDISEHRSQSVQPAMIELADHVFVMAPKHEEYLRRFIPALGDKLVRTWEWADEALTQIDDPVGQDLAAFQRCRDLIDRCMDNWFDSLP